MSEIGKRYDQIYSETEQAFGPKNSVENVLKYVQEGELLELGAGDGRNALFLAEKGFKVHAVDVSQVGVDKIIKQAQERGLEVQTEVADVREFDPGKSYDVLVSTFMFHHLTVEEANHVIGMMREHTKPEGLNVLVVFTDKGDLTDRPADKDYYLPSMPELADHYKDWEILESEEWPARMRSKRPDGMNMENNAGRVIARKPKAE